jgi:hypothetical protein
MKIPKGRVLLENTRLEFINLDNVLSASKRERAHKISGYISIIYPDSIELIFLKQGEPFNAARLSRTERCIVPISDVVERAKNATSGMLSEYATDEILVNLIISSITLEPIKTNVDFTRLQPKIFVDKLKNTQFNGFIWVKSGIEESFIYFESGEIKGCYVAGNAKQISGNEIITFLMKPNIKISIFDHIEDLTITQATPAQVDMFCKIFSALLKSYSHPIGQTLSLKTFLRCKSTVQKEFTFIEKFKVEKDMNITGKVVVEPRLFAQGMARWFDLIFESFSTFLGKESEVIAKKVLNDYRFALKSLNFFDYTKLKI